MSPYNTFQVFNAVKLHFTTLKYDFFKYSGKSKFGEAQYANAKGKFYFEKLGAAHHNRKDLVNFFVANFVDNTSKTFIGEFLDDECDDCYRDWQRRNQALFKYFTDDCHTIKAFYNEFDVCYKDMFFEQEGKFPAMFGLFNNDNISFETLVVLNKLTDFVNKRNYINPLSIRTKLRLKKYENFVKVDNLSRFGEAFTNIVIENE